MEQKVSRVALSVFLAMVVLVSVCGVVEAEANLRRGDDGSDLPSHPTATPTDYGSHGNGRVYQTERIPTALIFNVPKTTLYVGETLTVNARLINANTGYGIPWAIVRGYFSQDGINWVEPGTLTTDSMGGYSYTGTVPDYPGTYYGYVSYDGNDTYQGCEGSHYTITVLPQYTPLPTQTPLPTPIPIPTSSPNPTSTGSNQSAALGSLSVSASNTTTNVSANITSSIKPSSSRSSPGFDVAYGFIALAAIAFLKFRKKLVR